MNADPEPAFRVASLASSFYSGIVWHRQPYVIADLPGGAVAVASVKTEKLTWLAQHTRPNDFLFEPGWSASYFPLQVRNPVFIDGFDLRGITPPEYVESSIRQLDAKAVRYVLWCSSLELAIVQKHEIGDHLAVF
jgi:hypothetical protein